jgi:2-polyprenyl-6-methoxyphenol hydroxylase-like FAD-dependent oxidoreductase
MHVLIAGAGIGGLATALSLHARGIACTVFERSEPVRELGVGINTLPHAIKELADLGLLPALDRVGIRTHELIYANRHGQRIWRELRGTDAGFAVPQFSIHRGKLQTVLYEAVLDRLGPARIRTDHHLVSFIEEKQAGGVTARFKRRDGAVVEAAGDVLVGADGIHSVVRSAFYPGEGPPSWNGLMLWRGATLWPRFLTGRSMIIAGGMRAKLVLYPIHDDPATPDRTLLNWAVVARLGDGSAPPPRREDWNRPGRLEDLLPFVEGSFRIAEVDVPALIRATGTFYEYPMCDRDPVPRWSHGHVTLLGDAAHPMYPVGSNGASQAILDARCLADCLASAADPAAALAAYEAERLPKTAEIVRTNRLGGPERVIDVIEERAPDGFSDISEVASEEELTAIVRGYAQMAGFAREQVNKA